MIKSHRSSFCRLVLIGLVVGFLALAVQGQGAGGAATGPVAASESHFDPVTGEMPRFAELYGYSPVINGVIGVLSFLSVCMFLFFLLTINSRSMVPPDLVDEVTKLVVRAKYEAAGDLCRANRRVFIASLVQRCMENAGKPSSVVLNILEAEGKRRAELVWNRVSYLADIANVAPMLGLLGTVRGMIKAFFALPQQSGGIDSAVLANSIGEAMATTMFGLLVAIVSLLFYSIIKGQATRALAEAEQAVHSIVDHIKRRDSQQPLRVSTSTINAPDETTHRPRRAPRVHPGPRAAFEGEDL